MKKKKGTRCQCIGRGDGGKEQVEQCNSFLRSSNWIGSIRWVMLTLWGNWTHPRVEAVFLTNRADALLKSGEYLQGRSANIRERSWDPLFSFK